jgi:flagellar protein FliO/FliZ
MSVYLVGMSTLASFFKLVMLLIVFILILVASYYCTKWYAKSGLLKNPSSNIQVLESFSLGQGRQICIVQIGDKCLAIAICKEQITFLTELDRDSLMEKPVVQEGSFQDIFGEQLKGRFQTGHKRNHHKKE